MKRKIYEQIRNFRKGYYWTFQTWINFYNKLSTSEKEEFDSIMKKYVEKGYFVMEENGEVYDYVLTELGETELLNEY